MSDPIYTDEIEFIENYTATGSRDFAMLGCFCKKLGGKEACKKLKQCGVDISKKIITLPAQGAAKVLSK